MQLSDNEVENRKKSVFDHNTKGPDRILYFLIPSLQDFLPSVVSFHTYGFRHTTASFKPMERPETNVVVGGRGYTENYPQDSDINGGKGEKKQINTRDGREKHLNLSNPNLP